MAILPAELRRDDAPLILATRHGTVEMYLAREHLERAVEMYLARAVALTGPRVPRPARSS